MLLALALPMRAAESATGMRILGYSPEQLPAVRTMIDDAERTIRRFCPPERNPPGLTFATAVGIAPEENRLVVLPEDPAQARQAVIANLWLLRMRRGSGHVRSDTVPKWLIAATEWLMSQPLSTTPINNLEYPYSANYVRRRVVPDPIFLAAHPVSVNEPTLYPLYLESSAVLFLILWDNRDSVFARTLALYDDRQPAEANVQRWLPPFVRDDEARRRQWYTDKVSALTIRGGVLLSLEDADRIRSECEKITIAPTGLFADAVKAVPLDEIHLQMPDWQIPKSVLADVQNRFLDLQRRAPFLLRPAIADYLAVIPQFSRPGSRAAIKQFQDARAQFAADLARTREVEAILDREEAAAAARNGTYASPIPLLESHPSPTSGITKAIEATLDPESRQ